MTQEEKIKACLEDMSDTSLIEVYNEYCRANSYYEDEFLSMYVFDEFNCDKSPLEIVEYVRDCDFNPNDDYYQEGVFGPTSYSTYECAEEVRKNSLKELTNYIIDNDESFDNADLKDVLNEGEEDEAED